MTESKDKVVVAEAVAEKVTAPTPKKATKKAVAKAPAKIKVISKANGAIIFRDLKFMPNVVQEIDAELAKELLEKLPVWIKEVK